MTLSDREVALMATHYHSLFLRGDDPPRNADGSAQGADGSAQGADGSAQGGEGRPAAARRTPGPVTRAECSLGVRHMEDPLARALAALYYVPLLLCSVYARGADERDALSEAVIKITGLDNLLEDGRVLRAVVTWSAGRWPKRITGVRVSLPGGEAERRRLLGRFEPALRQMAKALAAPPYEHYAGRTRVGPPRR